MAQAKDDRLAFVLLIKSIMDQISEIAALKKQGSAALLSQQLLSETCSVLHDISAEQQAIYFETLLMLSDSFGSHSIRSINESYVENVAPAKRRFVDSIRGKLRAAAA